LFLVFEGCVDPVLFARLFDHGMFRKFMKVQHATDDKDERCLSSEANADHLSSIHPLQNGCRGHQDGEKYLPNALFHIHLVFVLNLTGRSRWKW